jgi:hypothetical protein
LAIAQITAVSGPAKSITGLSQWPGGLRFDLCLGLSKTLEGCPHYDGSGIA